MMSVRGENIKIVGSHVIISDENDTEFYVGEIKRVPDEDIELYRFENNIGTPECTVSCPDRFAHVFKRPYKEVFGIPLKKLHQINS